MWVNCHGPFVLKIADLDVEAFDLAVELFGRGRLFQDGMEQEQGKGDG